MLTDKLPFPTASHTSVNRSELDALPFPVIITDSIGKVIFKNSFAYKMKLIKINTNFKNLLDSGQYDEFLRFAKDRESAIIKCRIETGVTHAAVIPDGNGENIIYLAICSIALQKLSDFGKIELIHETYKLNNTLLNSYGKMCEKYKLISDPKAAELLKYNSLRFSRAARNMTLYIHTLTKTEGFEEENTVDLQDVCTKLVSHFSAKVAPLGFRLNISFDDNVFSTHIQKNTYVTVFLELCAIALRIASDSKCKIRMYKSDNKITAEYNMKTNCDKLASVAYSAEFDFVKIIAEHCKWDFAEMRTCDGESVFSFSVPVVINTPAFISSHAFPSGFAQEDIFNISDEVFTYLYFA